MGWVELLGFVREIVVMAAAGTGAVVAVLGLRTWRHQIKGKTEYDLARRLLRAAYEVREEFNRVFNPVMLGGEIATAYEEAEVDPADEKRRAEVVYSYRWRFLQRALDALNVESLEAEVLWGPKADELLSPLRKCASELWAALNEYVIRGEGDADRQRLVSIRRTIRGGGDDEPIRERVKQAVEDVESFVRPYLKL